MASSQPDFALISQHFEDLSNQFSRCPNLPALEGGQLINARLDTIHQTLAAMHQASQNMLATLVNTVASLQTSVQASQDMIATLVNTVASLQTRVITSDANAVARMRNSSATRADSALVSLQDVYTGVPIPGFPSTVDAIETLSSPEATRILHALGVPSSEGLIANRRLVRVNAGVTLQAIV